MRVNPIFLKELAVGYFSLKRQKYLSTYWSANRWSSYPTHLITPTYPFTFSDEIVYLIATIVGYVVASGVPIFAWPEVLIEIVSWS